MRNNDPDIMIEKLHNLQSLLVAHLSHLICFSCRLSLDQRFLPEIKLEFYQPILQLSCEFYQLPVTTISRSKD